MYYYRVARWAGNALIYALLIVVCIFMIFPFLWMLITSLKTADEIFHIPMILIPAHPDLHAYIYLIKQYHIFDITWNSFVIATIGTALSLFFCSLGGYAFAKFKFPGQGPLFAFLISTMVIPAAITLVPVFIIMRELDWIDTILPLVIPGAANAFGFFFMRQYISTISDDIMDAARMDGAGEFTIYWRIIVPIIAPGLTSLGLIFFMGAWNAILGPLIYLKTQSHFTLPLIIRSMTSTVGRSLFDNQMAASVISLIPLLIIFLVFQRRLMEGIAAGAVKG